VYVGLYMHVLNIGEGCACFLIIKHFKPEIINFETVIPRLLFLDLCFCPGDWMSFDVMSFDDS